ncbi:winged helix-turn-helix transcriptional regulator [Paraburkholderia sp. EG287A]|uniref:winged helix-turn-helix transcriptional regulator n=1 Tax=unclassified Paraburkholderia TaxID=2615204 RepID=UPI0034D3721F
MSASYPEETSLRQVSAPGQEVGRDASRSYSVYQEGCPARLIFERLADKWALLVVRLLKCRPTRFNQLRREIEGVSQKVLSQTLRRLERDGLVSREVITSMPVAVEYSLTELGRTLAEAIEPLTAWAVVHIEDVLSAQHQYDAQTAGRAR